MERLTVMDVPKLFRYCLLLALVATPLAIRSPLPGPGSPGIAAAPVAVRTANVGGCDEINCSNHNQVLL